MSKCSIDVKPQCRKRIPVGSRLATDTFHSRYRWHFSCCFDSTMLSCSVMDLVVLVLNLGKEASGVRLKIEHHQVSWLVITIAIFLFALMSRLSKLSNNLYFNPLSLLKIWKRNYLNTNNKFIWKSFRASTFISRSVVSTKYFNL